MNYHYFFSLTLCVTLLAMDCPRFEKLNLYENLSEDSDSSPSPLRNTSVSKPFGVKRAICKKTTVHPKSLSFASARELQNALNRKATGDQWLANVSEDCITLSSPHSTTQLHIAYAGFGRIYKEKLREIKPFAYESRVQRWFTDPEAAYDPNGAHANKNNEIARHIAGGHLADIIIQLLTPYKYSKDGKRWSLPVTLETETTNFKGYNLIMTQSRNTEEIYHRYIE